MCLIGWLPAFIDSAAAQQDILALPKNVKSLDWDWYNRGETRELTFNRFPGLSPDYSDDQETSQTLPCNGSSCVRTCRIPCTALRHLVTR
jgi:hypothetical protein